MGAGQSADDSDSETEDLQQEEEDVEVEEEESVRLQAGQERRREEEEEEVEEAKQLLQEPEIRPFEHPQSPLAPQDSDTIPPLPEPLRLSDSSPILDEASSPPPLHPPPSSSSSSPAAVRFATDGYVAEGEEDKDEEASISPPLPPPPPPPALPADSSPEEQLPSTAAADPEVELLAEGDNASLAPSPTTPPSAPSPPPTNSLVLAPLLSDAQGAVEAASESIPLLGDTTEVYVIRHAEATHNIATTIGGRAHSAKLTPKGRHQAFLLGSFLRAYLGIHFDAIYSSPLERSMATAVAVCEELGLPQEAIRIDEKLQELSQGEWEGKERQAVYTPQTLRIVNALQPDFRAPGGESQRQVEHRMMEFINSVVGRGWIKDSKKEILERFLTDGDLKDSVRDNSPQFQNEVSHHESTATKTDGETALHVTGRTVRVCVFSHGTAIKCLLRGILGSDPHMTHKLSIDNTSMTILKHTATGGWHVVRMNDTVHMAMAQRLPMNGLPLTKIAS